MLMGRLSSTDDHVPWAMLDWNTPTRPETLAFVITFQLQISFLGWYKHEYMGEGAWLFQVDKMLCWKGLKYI